MEVPGCYCLKHVNLGPGCDSVCQHLRSCTQAMAWLGPKLVACTSLEYLLLDVAADAATRLFALPAEAPPPTLIKRLPGGSPLAILLMVRAMP